MEEADKLPVPVSLSLDSLWFSWRRILAIIFLPLISSGLAPRSKLRGNRPSQTTTSSPATPARFAWRWGRARGSMLSLPRENNVHRQVQIVSCSAEPPFLGGSVVSALSHSWSLSDLPLHPLCRHKWSHLTPLDLKNRSVGLGFENPRTGNAYFTLDGHKFRIFGGSIHYFRVPREYWRDRLLKLKACGFNTVTT